MSTIVATTSNGESRNADQERVAENGRCQQTCQSTFSPRFDIWEGESELVLYGDLPGVEPNSLEIEFENRQLSIHGKVGRCHDNVNSLLSEYGLGDFRRSFAIGEKIDSEGIHAELRDGVLKIHLPKVEEAKPRRIQVKAN